MPEIALPHRTSRADDRRMTPQPPDGRAGIDADLVKRLISAQFPRWSALPVAPVEVDGWDNRTYRLGDTMTVRLPTAAGCAPAVSKENRRLPRLAPALPLPVPVVLGEGEPGEGCPYPWSVRGWLPGDTTAPDRITDLDRFAVQVAGFLGALQRCDPTGGPVAGAHSWYRGASPARYDEETRRCLTLLKDHVDTGRAAAVWGAALAAEWHGTPVWFHGGIAHGNLLVENGGLSAVIDFGTSGVGDPACDLVIAWTMFAGTSRTAFREAVGADDATWARARGWALWKAMLVLWETLHTDRERAEANRYVIGEVLADHDRYA